MEAMRDSKDLLYKSLYVNVVIIKFSFCLIASQKKVCKDMKPQMMGKTV